MALQLDDATAIINRTSGLVAASSDYCCCFWFQPQFELGAVADYITAVAITNAGYTAWAGIFSDNGANPQTYQITANNGGGASNTANHRIPSGRIAHFGYRRSGTSHFFYVNGILVGSATESMAAVTFAEMFLGNDNLSVVDSPLVFWDFKEWDDDKSFGVIQLEMRTIGSVANTVNLWSYAPFVSNLNDASGNGRNWSGAGNFSFVSQPTLPSNLNPSGATTLPFGLSAQTITQSLSASEVSLPVYYKYENATGQDVVISLGHWGDLTASGAGYNPHCDGYVFEDLSGNIYDGFINGSGTFPLPSGMTMWFEFKPDSALNTPYAAATLNIKTIRGPEGAFTPGDVFIRSASFVAGPDLDEVPEYSGGLHAGFIRPTESRIIGYIPLFPCGETGDILPTSHRMCFLDEGISTEVPPAGYYPVIIYDETFTEIARTYFFSNFLPPVRNRTHLQTEKFYLLGYFTGAPANANTYATVNADGAISASTPMTLTATGGFATAIAAAADEDYLFVANDSGVIKRWDLSGLTFASNLAAAVAGYDVTDILVLMDRSIIACYFKPTTTRDVFVRRYDESGTILNTYNFTFSAAITGIDPRLGYSANDETFWVFNHLVTGYSDIRQMNIDGTMLVQSITPDVQQSSIEQADPPIPYTSDSCPIIELRSGEGVAGVAGIIGPLIWVEWPRRVVA